MISSKKIALALSSILALGNVAPAFAPLAAVAPQAALAQTATPATPLTTGTHGGIVISQALITALNAAPATTREAITALVNRLIYAARNPTNFGIAHISESVTVGNPAAILDALNRVIAEEGLSGIATVTVANVTQPGQIIPTTATLVTPGNVGFTWTISLTLPGVATPFPITNANGGVLPVIPVAVPAALWNIPVLTTPHTQQQNANNAPAAQITPAFANSAFLPRITNAQATNVFVGELDRPNPFQIDSRVTHLFSPNLFSIASHHDVRVAWETTPWPGGVVPQLALTWAVNLTGAEWHFDTVAPQNNAWAALRGQQSPFQHANTAPIFSFQPHTVGFTGNIGQMPVGNVLESIGGFTNQGAEWTLLATSQTAGFLTLHNQHNPGVPGQQAGPAFNVNNIPLLSLIRTVGADGAAIVMNATNTQSYAWNQNNLTTTVNLTTPQTSGMGVSAHDQIVHRSRLEFTVRLTENIIGQFTAADGGVLELVAPNGFSWPTPATLVNQMADVTNADWGVFGVAAAVPTIGFSRPLNNNTVLRVHIGSAASDVPVASRITGTTVGSAAIVPLSTNPAIQAPISQINIQGLRLNYDGTSHQTRDVIVTAQNAAFRSQQAGDTRDASGGIGGSGTGAIFNYDARPSVVQNNQALNVGTISDWVVTLEVIDEDIPTLLSARLVGQNTEDTDREVHGAARVLVSEVVPQSWHEERGLQLTLPEGVHIREANIETITRGGRIDSNLPPVYRDALERPGALINHYNWGVQNRVVDQVVINNNVITVSNLERVEQNQIIEFYLDLDLSISPAFEGDITLSLGGRGVNNEYDTPYVVIAEAIAPITVNTQVTNIRLGYQFVPVGNFTIVENVAGAFVADQEVFITVTDEIFTELAVAPGFNWAITEGDLAVTQMRTPVHLTGLVQGAGAPHIIFEVASASTVPSTIAFSNIQLRQVMVSPLSNVGYNLVVWGPGIAQNFNHPLVQTALDGSMDGLGAVGNIASTTAYFNLAPEVRLNRVNPRDLFHVSGFSAPFITIGTTGTQVVDQVVTFSTAGVVTVGGQAVSLDPAYWGSFEIQNGVSLLPARMAFSLFFPGSDPNDNVLFAWDSIENRFTIDPAGRNIQFQRDNTQMIVAGLPRTILAGEGDSAVATAPFIHPTTNRLMVPVRAFAEALGLSVAWDAATSTVTLTPQN